jgi:hypothetical protein
MALIDCSCRMSCKPRGRPPDTKHDSVSMALARRAAFIGIERRKNENASVDTPLAPPSAALQQEAMRSRPQGERLSRVGVPGASRRHGMESIGRMANPKEAGESPWVERRRRALAGRTGSGPELRVCGTPACPLAPELARSSRRSRPHPSVPAL